MPEKNGCTVTVGTGVPVVVPLAVATVVADWMLVTKNSSVPTLSTAFWLFNVATRGLESTWTLPGVSRNCCSAEKF